MIKLTKMKSSNLLLLLLNNHRTPITCWFNNFRKRSSAPLRFECNGGALNTSPSVNNSIVVIIVTILNRLASDCQCKQIFKKGIYSRFRFRFEYFRYGFLIVFASIIVSIFVFVNDSNVFSLTTIFVFGNEINTDVP